MEARTAPAPTAVLQPHPDTGETPATGIEVHVERDGVLLWLRFVVQGDVERVAWPVAVDQGRADDLWRHTCFEAFVATDDGYVEYNLSPSNRWASYRFNGPRAGMRAAEVGATVEGLDAGLNMVALEARIALPSGARRLGLSAVIETTEGEMSYWALAHPSAKPDFHHPDSFVLDLP